MDQRDWENDLFSAEADGRISDRALLLGMRLSRVITWDSPRPGVYWQGPSLWELARVAKTTFYRLRGELIEAGLLDDHRGNLFPASPTSETESPANGTGSPTDGTGSPTDGTYMHAFALLAAQREPDHQKPGAITLGPDTSPAEIEAAFPVPTHFASRAAATLVVASLRRWPDAQRPRFSALARQFEKAREQHTDSVIWQGLLRWLEESEGSTSMRSPGAVFSKQADEVFEEVAAERAPQTQEEAR